MANYRLKISNFIPNSWLSKNKMTKKQPPSSSATNPHNHDQPVADQRKSYHFTRDLSVDTHKEDSPPKKTRSPDRPRKSTKKRRPLTNKKPVHQLVSVWTGSNSSDTEFLSPELPISSRDSLSCSCNTTSSYDEVYGKVDLPPIITKPVKKVVVGSDTHTRSPVKRYPGGKVKGNSYSPRVGNRVRVQGINGGRRSHEYRRSLSESMAVVKTSVDPGRDFKESMVEMIMENNMKSSKDLEDLLACYLSLNSDEYHDLIIKVFKQIWFECTNIRL